MAQIQAFDPSTVTSEDHSLLIPEIVPITADRLSFLSYTERERAQAAARKEYAKCVQQIRKIRQDTRIKNEHLKMEFDQKTEHNLTQRDVKIDAMEKRLFKISEYQKVLHNHKR